MKTTTRISPGTIPGFLPVFAAFFLVVGVSNSRAGIIENGAKLERVADGFQFTEGPACDAEGAVYFTDQPSDRILKWGADGKLSTWKQPAGRANGLCFDDRGNLWVCADAKNELWKISPAGDVEVVLSGHGGRLFNGPNDIWLRPAGGCYFTDPYYERPYWQRHGIGKEPEVVYYLAPGGADPVPVITDLHQPNGIIGTPDGHHLYVSDIADRKTYCYAIGDDGTLGEKTLFCEAGSDGMTIDSEGNVYLTNERGVTVFDRGGKEIENIPVPERWTGNVCFGGADRRTLFVTASKSFYAIRMNVSGVGSQ